MIDLSISKKRILLLVGLVMTVLAIDSVVMAQEELSKRDRKRILAGARELSRAFNLASEKAMPSVVRILSRTKEARNEDSILSIIGGEDEQVFDSVGSGVIISEDGYIITNHHVIQNSIRSEVRLFDGREFEVVESRSDPRSDVAIIRIDAGEDLPVAELAEDDELFVGQWVLAIGSPFMLESSVSAGIVSGTRRYRNLSRTVSGQFLQTDAAINPGNSGGPLINLDGQVVGINTAISSRTGSFNGIGFAIPINRADWIQQELLEHDKVRRGYIGVRTAPVSYDMRQKLKKLVPPQGGALVNSVVPNYPGDKAGLRAGDIIVSFDGQTIGTAPDFAAHVQQSPIEIPLKMEVVRDEQIVELTVELQERLQ